MGKSTFPSLSEGFFQTEYNGSTRPLIRVSERRCRTTVEWLAADWKPPNSALNFGFGPYTLLFTFQTVASQLVYRKVKRPSECSLVENKIFPTSNFLEVLLSNTLKRIKRNLPIKQSKKFLLVILRIPKHTFCTIFSPKVFVFSQRLLRWDFVKQCSHRLKANGSNLRKKSTMRSLKSRPGCFLRFPRAEKQMEASEISKLGDTTTELLRNSRLVF